MRRKHIWLFALLSFLLYRCELEDMEDVIDCNYCEAVEQDSSSLELRVTINSENPVVPLEIYRGNYEDGVLDLKDTAYEASWWIYSKVGVEYTVLARYKDSKDSILVFDSEKMTIYESFGECGYRCYYVENYILDLQLAREEEP